MTIMLGMNDGRNANHTPADDEVYFTGYRHIIEAVRHAIPALRITAIEPSPFDDVTRPYTLQPDGYNAVLVKYGDWLRHYAADARLDVADLNTSVVAMLRKAKCLRYGNRPKNPSGPCASVAFRARDHGRAIIKSLGRASNRFFGDDRRSERQGCEIRLHARQRRPCRRLARLDPN